MTNKSDLNCDDENDREVSDWDNNNMNDSYSDEDNTELESNSRENNKCVMKSKAKEVVRKYRRMKFINKAKVACTFPGCGAVVLKRNYKYHLDLHSDETFKCHHKRCNEVFKTRYRLNQHKIKHVGKYHCDSDGCNFIANCSGQLDLHKFTHSEERTFKCQYCDKCFKGKYGLEYHIKREHPEERPDLPQLKCEVNGCEYQTKSKAGFNQHKRIHSHPFQCNVCHQRFATEEAFENHKYIHSKDKSSKKSFQCKSCSRNFSVHQNLQLHINYSHKPNNNDMNNSDKNNKKEQELNSCNNNNKCVKKSNIGLVGNRRKTSTKVMSDSDSEGNEENGTEVSDWDNNNDVNDSDSEEDNDEVEEESNPSNINKFVTRSKAKKIKGKNRNMKINDKTKLACTFPGCGVVLSNQKNFSYHMDMHSDQTFKCKHKGCNKSFNTRYSRRRHNYKHLGKFKCNFDGCDYNTNCSAKLKKHKTKHSDERPMKCQHCDKCFKHNIALEDHIEKLHPDQCTDKPLLNCLVIGCQYQTKSRYSLPPVLGNCAC